MRNYFFDRASPMDDYCQHVEALGACQPGLDHAAPFRDKTFGDWIDAYVASDESDSWGAWCLLKTWSKLDTETRTSFIDNIGTPAVAAQVCAALYDELAPDVRDRLFGLVEGHPIYASRLYVGPTFDVLTVPQRNRLLATFHSGKTLDGKPKLPTMERRIQRGDYGAKRVV